MYVYLHIMQYTLQETSVRLHKARWRIYSLVLRISMDSGHLPLGDPAAYFLFSATEEEKKNAGNLEFSLGRRRFESKQPPYLKLDLSSGYTV